MNKLFFWSSVIVALFLAAGDAQAFKISISDPKVELKAERGQVISGSITITNPADQEVSVKVYMEDFIYVEPFDGSKKFLMPGSTPFSCASWISFSPQEFTLLPFGKQNIDYTVRVPDDARGGSYSVLFFETNLGEMQNAEGYKVDVLGRVGSLFFIEMTDGIKKAEVKDLRASSEGFSGEFINSGEVFINAKTTFYVLDQEGMVIDRGEAPELYIFPPDKAVFTLSTSRDMASGDYTAVITFDLKDGDALVREIDFRKERNGGITVLSIRE